MITGVDGPAAVGLRGPGRSRHAVGMRAVIAGVTFAGLVLGSAGTARADGDRGGAIAADLTSDAVLIAGVKLDSGPLMIAGALGYALAAPGVHAYHDRWTEGAESLTVRIIAPLALGAIGCKILDDSDDGPDDGDGGPAMAPWGCILGGALGVMVGGLGAQVVDWTVFSTGEDTTDATARAHLFTIGGSF